MTESEGGAAMAGVTANTAGITEAVEEVRKGIWTAEAVNETAKDAEAEKKVHGDVSVKGTEAQKVEGMALVTEPKGAEEKKEDKKICQCLFSMIP